nr:hypothetical protein [Tanacetum cinerariifolium]
CVPDVSSLQEAVLSEAHSSLFSIHPGSTKMYRDLKQNFWWNGMKHDVARDPRFTLRFWKGLQNAWGTRLKFSTAFYPQNDGQTERTIQTLKDMLRSCALEWTGNWDECLCLVEFAYNNSWYASIKGAPFEFLGVRRFGLKGKLSPRFIGPFEILDRVGYNYHPYHVVQYPFDKIHENLSFTEEPEAILDRQERVMRKKTIPLVKVLWKNHPEREATW